MIEASDHLEEGATAPGHAGRMSRLGAALALCALVAASHGGSLGNGFVADDHTLVVGNELVRLPPWRLDALLAPPGTERLLSYRPLRLWTYMVDHAVAGGIEPIAFHLSNLAYHAACALALASLAAAVTGAPAAGFVAGALFAVHPLGSEAVVYVSGRRDLVCGLLVLLSLRAWWAFLGARRRRLLWLALAVALGALALAAKETAVVLPLLAGLLAVLRRPRTRTFRAIGLATAASSGAVALMISLYGEWIAPAGPRPWTHPLAPQPALSLAVLARYAALAVWPAELSADYRLGAFALPVSSWNASAVLVAIGLAALVIAGSWLLSRGSVAGVGLLWFVVALLPVAQIVPYAEVVAERNAYLPLAGLALAAGEGFRLLAARRPYLAWGLVAALVVAMGGRTAVRARDWRDDLTLWSRTAAAHPGSLRAERNLGIALAATGQLDEGRRRLEAALAIHPSDHDTLIALARVYGRERRYARARKLATRALALAEQRDSEGDQREALIVRGWAEIAAGNDKRAIRSFRRVLSTDPANREAAAGLARASARGAADRRPR